MPSTERGAFESIRIVERSMGIRRIGPAFCAHGRNREALQLRASTFVSSNDGPRDAREWAPRSRLPQFATIDHNLVPLRSRERLAQPKRLAPFLGNHCELLMRTKGAWPSTAGRSTRRSFAIGANASDLARLYIVGSPCVGESVGRPKILACRATPLGWAFGARTPRAFGSPAGCGCGPSTLLDSGEMSY